MSEMTFGKYKGKPVAEVLASDPRYALWAHENVRSFKLSPGEIQDCLARSDAPRWFPRSGNDDHDCGSDEYGGMSYSDFGNN